MGLINATSCGVTYAAVHQKADAKHDAATELRFEVSLFVWQTAPGAEQGLISH